MENFGVILEHSKFVLVIRLDILFSIIFTANMVESIWHTSKDGVRESSIGDKLVSGSHPNWIPQCTKDLNVFLSHLPDDIRTYTLECLEEHRPVIDFILSSGYELEELSYHDYLSWPYPEISGNNILLLREAFEDVRYELIPTIRFWNAKTKNPEDDTAESSALTIEFHKRGMAF